MKLLLSTFLLLAALYACEAQVEAPALVPASKPTKAPGLMLTLTAGGKSDTKTSRLLALHVPAGETCSPFLPKGAFSARWEGNILSPLRSEYTISAVVQGALKLTINGELIFEGAGDSTAQTLEKAVPLRKGANPIVLEFLSDGKEDALVRLYWSGSDFFREPVAPSSFSHDPTLAVLREGSRLREGRLLFAQMRCLACHDGESLAPSRAEFATAMPELSQDAPIFNEFGARFTEAWMTHWISNPHQFRAGTLMPSVFPSKDGAVDQRAADLAAFLVAQGTPDTTAPAVENAPLGGALFAKFGCIACHTTPDIAQPDEEYQRVSLAHVKAKWQPAALRAFLKNPQEGYAWRKMPHFRLTDEEAERITAYLLSTAAAELPPAPKGDPAKGVQWLVSANCLNCHAGSPPTTTPKLAATLAGGWKRGCMAPDDASRGAAPDFHLTPVQREALLSFGSQGPHAFASLRQDTPGEIAERQFRTLRCASCHSRDDVASVWSQVEAEAEPLLAGAPESDQPTSAEPHAPMPVPALTWTGEKLNPAWSEKFIAGADLPKPRPWLVARMPGFPTQAALLAHGLSVQHGFSTQPEPARPKAEPIALDAGKALVNEGGGFNCVQCHGIEDRQATAVFEAPGINLAYSHSRIRAHYYDRWMLHPLRIDPDTKMPKFSDDEGRTPLTDFFEGDARKQFNAIWDYLGTLKWK